MTGRRSDPFATPLWWRLWFAFVAVLGLALLGLVAWAIIEVVGKVTR